MRATDPRANRALRRLGVVLGDRYRIVRLIGIGGMATVYEATDRGGQAVAVKLLHENLSADPDVERLFRREAGLASKIRHPGVVPVVDQGVGEDGSAFLVMPLLRGETLRARAERGGGALPLEEVIQIGHAVLEALAAAHAEKIVHRDLKPANIFVTESGDVRVLDFGIARFFDAEGAATATASGLVLGTPAFMAPEQALGRSRLVDGRTDLWGLAATLFTLISGRFVHDGEGAGELAMLAATTPARRLADVAPAVPFPLCDVLDRALAFDQAARWPDAATMDAALVAACRAALGKSPSELAKLEVSPIAPSEALDTLPARPVDPSSQAAASPASLERSSEAVILPEAASATAPRRGLRRWALGSASAAILAVAAAALPLARSRAPSSPAAATATRADATAPPASPDLASPGSSPVPQEVLADYQAAVQLWRDASISEATEKLASTTLKAPSFAAAHLWFVMATGYATPASRAHYADAVTYRNALTEVQSEFLEAYRPAMNDPPDYALAVSQLGDLARRRPEIVEIRIEQARLLVRMADIAGADAALGAIHGAASLLGIVLLNRAVLASYDADPSRGLSLLRECVDRSPSAMTCLHQLWELSDAGGRCTDLESICRTISTRSPSSPDGYQCLADAFFSTGASVAEARAAYAEAYKRMEASDVPLARAADDTWLAVAAGRPDLGANAAKAWLDLADRSGADPNARTATYEAYVALSLEVGRRDAAIGAAREFMTESRSWPRTSAIDLDATSIFLRSEAGDLEQAERRPLRARVIASTEDASYGPPLRRWYNGYAATAWTHDEAVDAIAHVPSPLMSTQGSDDDYLFGTVFALGGDGERAARLFARAARSCGLADDFYRTKAKLALARRAETRPEDACSLYADVATHWGDAVKSVSAAMARSKAHAMQCQMSNSSKESAR